MEANEFAEKVFEKLYEIELNLRQLKEDVKVLKEDVSVLKEDVSVLKEDVKVLKEDVNALKEDVIVLKGDVQALNGGQGRILISLDEMKLDLQYAVETANESRKEVYKVKQRIFAD